MRRQTLITLSLAALVATSLAALAAPRSEEKLPKIIRWVCTDRLCGGCDGQCDRADGHVALSRRGHCACTPEEGSTLDQAIRREFRKQALKR